jgi:hypothetical protein
MQRHGFLPTSSSNNSFFFFCNMETLAIVELLLFLHHHHQLLTIIITGALLFPTTSQQLQSLHKFWSQPISPSPPVFPATQFLIPQNPTHFSSATSRLFCVR